MGEDPSLTAGAAPREAATDMGAEAEEVGEVASCPLAPIRSNTARRWYRRRKAGIARPTTRLPRRVPMVAGAEAAESCRRPER